MDSRKNFYAELISNASDNMRSLWRTVNGILHPGVVNIVGLSSKVLADFFISKVSKTIQRIRDKVNILHIVRCSDPRYEGEQMDTLTPVTDNEVRKLISSLPNKTSPLDLMPTNILKLCADILSPFIVRMANLSFQTGIFPTSFRIAQVTPILKKQGLSADDPASFRPISNLLTVSKIL